MKTTQKMFVVFALTIFSLTATAKVQSLPLPEKEWTFLLFLNGHNNLSSFGHMNIKDMEKSGSTDQVNMVVEWGKSDDVKTHRFLVEKSTDPSKVSSPMLMSRPNVDMGDYKNLVDFVKWGAENFPAKHYFVAVWNHGSGWHFQDMAHGKLAATDMTKLSSPIHINDISYDDNSGHHITTEQLGVAMSDIKTILGRNVDIYGSDACLMQMIEVASEMKDSVNYFVGSQDLEPGAGWPYAPFIQKWTATPTMTPAEVSVLLSKEYLKSYSKGGVYGQDDVTFSAMDVTKLDALNASTTALVTHLKSMDAASLKKVKVAAAASQDFYYSDYKDLGDFLKRIEALQINADQVLISQVKSDLAAVVLSTDNSSSFAGATGLSIWMPGTYDSSSYMTRYQGLQFDKLTNWSSLISAMAAIP